MTIPRKHQYGGVLLLLILLAGCFPALSRSATPPTGAPITGATAQVTPPSPTETRQNAQPASTPTLPVEVEVQHIPIDGPAAQAQAEISGMGWYREWLVLLPQFPDRVEDAVYALQREDILAFLDGQSPGPLTPQAILIDTSLLRGQISKYEGFEAIVFQGDEVFLTVEASPVDGMKSYLVKGHIQPDLSEIVLDVEQTVEAPLPTQISNFSNEALTIQGDRLFVFYEANGTGALRDGWASSYDLLLNQAGTLVMPPLEYRLTDASTVDENGRFWVINYFFPGDFKILPSMDPLAEQFGRGATHAVGSVVERLVELQLPAGGEYEVTFTGRPPVQFQLTEGLISRNWEGLVRLENRGFLIATDKFPETILGFVPFQP